MNVLFYKSLKNEIKLQKKLNNIIIIVIHECLILIQLTTKRLL